MPVNSGTHSSGGLGELSDSIMAVLLLCLWQRLYCHVKPASRMEPASGNPQVFPLVFDRVADLVPVRDVYTAEFFRKFPWMAGIARPLVFIQDDLPVCIHPPGAVYPHATFVPGRTDIFIYQHRHLVCLQHMVTVHLFMQVIVEDRKITVCTLDCSVCHVLPGNMQAVTQKFLLLAVERHCIDIFDIHHGCFQ